MPNPFDDRPYHLLSEEEQAQVDAFQDSTDRDGLCCCGKDLDKCSDSYEHMTRGF